MPRKINVRLSADGVIAPALNAARISTEAIAIAFRAIDESDLDNIPDFKGTFFQMKFKGPDEGADQIKLIYKNWLLAKGFQDITRGIRETIEQAYLYSVVALLGQKKTTWGEYQDTIKAARDDANKANVPVLLDKVGEMLKEPLTFHSDFLSIQSIRNCLEHRNGLVTSKDCKGTTTLALTLPALATFVERNGKEIEIDREFRVEAGEDVIVRRVSRRIDYAVGDRIEFNVQQFHEIAMASFLFAKEIASKLPKVSPAKPD